MEIIEFYRSADVIVLVGTQSRRDEPIKSEAYGNFEAFVFRGSRGRYSNRSCGIIILMRRRLRRFVHSVALPPLTLRGRSAVIRFLGPHFDLTIFATYFPPVVDASSRAAADALHNFNYRTLCSLPARTFIVYAGDVDARIGRIQSEFFQPNCLPDFENHNGALLRSLCESHYLSPVNLEFDPSPTHYSATECPRRLDYVAVPFHMFFVFAISGLTVQP